MPGRYVSGIDFPTEIGPNWRHTSDITFDIRDEWGSPMHGYLFRIIIQAGSDPLQRYLIPGGGRFLQPAGFFISIINASIALRGFIHLTSYTSALKEYAFGSCSYNLPDPTSRLPRHPILINTRLQYRAGNSTQITNNSSTDTPDTRGLSVTTGVGVVIAQGSTTGTRTFGYRTATQGTGNSVSRELREGLKTFDMHQQG